jgi:hypothetical protein
MILSVCHCDQGAADHVHAPDPEGRPRGNRHSQNIRIGELTHKVDGLTAANEGYKRDLTVMGLWIVRLCVTWQKGVKTT